MLALASTASAQYISITSQSAIYTEDFNTLSTSGTAQSTLPSGWWISESPGNTTYRAGDGSTNSGDTYSYGTGTNSDRALGGVASGSVVPNFGVRYINNSGSSFSSFSFNLMMEQWRSGGRTGLDSLYFYYSVNNSLDSSGVARVVTGSWTRVAACDMVSKVTQGTAAAFDGNISANRQYYIFTVSGLTVNNGDTLWLRWRDPNVGGSDDGLGIDDYSFSVAAPLPVKWASFTADKNADLTTILRWTTASENNSSHFEIQRSTDNKKFETIGSVKGAGTSIKKINYSFTDVANLSAKTIYYRLKQVDFDGKTDYSKTVSVVNTIAVKGISSTLPNPFNDELDVTITAGSATTATVVIMDMIGKVHHTTTEQLQAGSTKVNINTADMPDGIYFVRVSYNNETFTQKVIKK